MSVGTDPSLTVGARLMRGRALLALRARRVVSHVARVRWGSVAANGERYGGVDRIDWGRLSR
jgi:hypothetical protein